jgi:hypothetical protein
LTGVPPPTAVETLGQVSVPSGTIVVVDFGMLRIWSHDQAPRLTEQDAPRSTVKVANACQDLLVTGADALRAAAALNLAAVRGPYVLDVTPEFATELGNRLRAICARDGLTAHLEALPARLPHAQRARELVNRYPEGTEVPFHGLWAVALRLPVAGPLPVRGQRMDPAGSDAGRWWSVWVELSGDAPVAAMREAGTVLVDRSRLMFGDLDSLASWRAYQTLDGLADVVFWGAEAEPLAAATRASVLGEEWGSVTYGWRDQPAPLAAELADRVRRTSRRRHRRVVVDERPHDLHHHLLEQARASGTESGTVTLGDSQACGFFTSWGDGAFPVYRDLDVDGRLLRVRIELGCPAIVTRTRKFEESWFGEFAKAAIVSARVARDRQPVGWLYREAPDHDGDSGWRVFAGDEDQAYIDDPGNAVVLLLRNLIERDGTLEDVFRTAAPCAFERARDSDQFRAVPPPA